MLDRGKSRIYSRYITDHHKQVTMNAATTRGAADAWRDRWKELNTIIEFLRTGGDPNAGNSIPRLLEELRSYYDAGIMPADVKAGYEAKIHKA